MVERIEANEIKLNYIAKLDLTGSFRGMRYLFRRAETEEGELLRVIVWPEPFICEKTPDEEKETVDFPFSQEGAEMAAAWLNEKYKEKEELWSSRMDGCCIRIL